MSERIERHATPGCAAAAVGLIAALSAAVSLGGTAAADPSPAPFSATAPPAAHAPLSATASPAAHAPSAVAAPPAADLSTADDIRDIRGPKHIFPFWQVVAVLAGAALLAIGVYALWAWRRRPRLRKLEL